MRPSAAPARPPQARHYALSLKWVGSSKRNGELLTLILAERFEAFLTVDRNIEFQQNIQASGVAIVVVVARTNRLRELRPLAPTILEALGKVKAGDLIRVGA